MTTSAMPTTAMPTSPMTTTMSQRGRRTRPQRPDKSQEGHSQGIQKVGTHPCPFRSIVDQPFLSVAERNTLLGYTLDGATWDRQNSDLSRSAIS